jgi:hypothetical protein
MQTTAETRRSSEADPSVRSDEERGVDFTIIDISVRSRINYRRPDFPAHRNSLYTSAPSVFARLGGCRGHQGVSRSNGRRYPSWR